MEHIFSTIDHMKDAINEMAPLSMRGREERKTAANSETSAQDQRSEFQGTEGKHRKGVSHDSQQPSGNSESPIAESGSGTSEEGCCQCTEEDYRDHAGRSVRMCPCVTAMIERQTQRLTGQEQELKVQTENDADMEANEDYFAGNPDKLNGSSAVFQKIYRNPVRHVPKKPVRWIRKLERGGEGVYNNCDCMRKNGLQDDCRVDACYGRPECHTTPPTCLPSTGIWYNGQH
jgi:hypothetical protein